MRRMLQDSQGKLGNVRKRIEDLRLEVALSGLPTEQKNNYLRLIEEKAALFSILSRQILSANESAWITPEKEAKELVTNLLDLNDDVMKIQDLFVADKIQQTRSETTPTSIAHKELKTPEPKARETFAPVRNTPTNPKLEAEKKEVTASYIDASEKFKNMRESLARFSKSVAPSQMQGLSLEQKSQRIANVRSMQTQFFELEAKVNNIGKILGSMASSVTLAQVIQMKKTVKEISDGSGIIENRITKERNRTSQEQADLMPREPTTVKQRTTAYFGRDEQLKRFYSNTYYGFVRTAISDLFERFYQAHQHYLLSIFSL